MSAAVKLARASAPPRYYAMFWRWHFFAALIVIPFVLWQSTTGTLYLWSQWWTDRAHPELRFVPVSDRMLPPGMQVAAALESLPDRDKPGAQLAMAHVHMGTAMQPNGAATHMAMPMPAAKGPPVLDVLLPDDPARSTAVVLQNANGLPVPIFVDPHTGRVLGSLTAAQWMPGWSRSLHGGWPLGNPGSWLLELGDCWAIVMILTGFYLWWPRARPFPQVLWPRFRSGARILLRDLHSSVAVVFSGIFLFFLVSALPWTSFWGGQILPRVESLTGQISPAGFSAGGAPASQFAYSLPSLDQAVRDTRSRGVRGILDVRLSPGAGVQWWLANVYTQAPDHTLQADTTTGRITSDFTNAQIPAIPRFVAFGVHIHQADFGLVNLWVNAAFALSLIWLTITGVAAWWIRRPAKAWGAPPKARIGFPKWLVAGAAVMSILLPIFGLSVVLLAAADRLRQMVNLRRSGIAGAGAS
jgi:uncharacterized iron-regulated membrane protein